MKSLVLFLAMVLASQLSMAQTPNNNFKSCISEIVLYPSQLNLNETNNFALVDLSVSENGTLSVHQINASSELKKYVLSRLNGYKLINSKGLSGKRYALKLNFEK
ncbi:MAG: hypothetical protein JXR60_00730 [Bacteroidales bacterium]|nr:hypothetical protein [Bacteroidales bacterium]